MEDPITLWTNGGPGCAGLDALLCLIGIESDKGPKLNFKGYSLGNAAMNLDIESSSKVPFAHRMGLIPDEQNEDLVNSCEGKYFGNSNPDCLRNLENFQWEYEMAPKRLLDLETSRQILHAMPAEVSGP